MVHTQAEVGALPKPLEASVSSLGPKYYSEIIFRTGKNISFPHPHHQAVWFLVIPCDNIWFFLISGLLGLKMSFQGEAERGTQEHTYLMITGPAELAFVFYLITCAWVVFISFDFITGPSKSLYLVMDNYDLPCSISFTVHDLQLLLFLSEGTYNLDSAHWGYDLFRDVTNWLSFYGRLLSFHPKVRDLRINQTSCPVVPLSSGIPNFSLMV